MIEVTAPAEDLIDNYVYVHVKNNVSNGIWAWTGSNEGIIKSTLDRMIINPGATAVYEFVPPSDESTTIEIGGSGIGFSWIEGGSSLHVGYGSAMTFDVPSDTYIIVNGESDINWDAPAF